MINKTSLFTALFALLLGVLLLVPFVSRADAPPHLVSYQGHLLDSSGAPLTGTTTITFALYSTALDSTPFWTETQTVTMDHGLFSVLLGSVTPLDPADFNGGQAWLGIQPAGSAELLPRRQISSVPYALYAGNADPTVVQARVTGSCSYGYAIKSIAADGSVSCNNVGITAIYKGTGILGDGSATTMGQATIAVDTTVIQRRVNGSCAVGSSIRAINRDGTVVCDPPPAVQACRITSNLTDGTTQAWITATLASLDTDSLGCWDGTSNYITAPRDGFYQLGAIGGIAVHLNGSGNTSVDNQGTGVRLQLDTGDIIESSMRPFNRPGTGGMSPQEAEGRASISSVQYLFAGTKIYMLLLAPVNEQANGDIWLRYLGQ